MQELNGKTAIVTGGGRGLGEAICRVLCEAGATVVAADVREELVQKLANDLRGRGFKAAALPLDVGDERNVREAIDRVASEYGKLDIVVNNAGVDRTLSIDEMPVDAWDSVIRVNLRGPFLMSKYALEAMKRQGSGQIVNVVSTASKRAWANASAYHASKWGLLGFSHALHVEARQKNIKVTAVVSGGMRTPFLLERFPDIDLANLQDPRNVAETIRFVLTQPAETVIPEVMVIPMRETSWP
jgi:NAD(P)-dependent dehydrogenase (short-subunit alcohol dehydrogenase family)